MKKLLTFVAITAISLTICAQPKLTPSNIDDVVKALTLQEKASLLVGYTMGQSYFGLPSAPDPNAKEIVPGAAGNTASIQRLGIPYTVVSDGPAGTGDGAYDGDAGDQHYYGKNLSEPVYARARVRAYGSQDFS